MNWKTIVVLMILAAGLGGFFYYDTYWLTPAREKVASSKGRLWIVEPKDVEALTIRRKGNTVSLKRVEGGWEMLEPVNARGDRGVIDEVVTDLATARMDREIDAGPSKLADFGLDPAEAEVMLQVKGRQEPLALLVGGKNPTGAWVYAKQASKPAVVTLSELVSRDVSRPVTDFRDRTVIAFDRKAVTAMDLDIGGEKISVTSDEPGRWRIVKPGPYRADVDMITDLLDKLEGAKAKEFAADVPKSLAPYGLDQPTRVTLWLGKDKERASRTLLFGREEVGHKGVYVMRDGDASVMLAPSELWQALPKTVAALRDKVVVPYAYDKVNRLEVDHAGSQVVLEKDGLGGWKISAPEALRADAAVVNSLLWRIRDLRTSGFLAEAASDVPRYLTRPELTVKIWEEGAKEPTTLLLQSSSERRGGQPAALAAVQGQGPVMLVDAKALRDLAPGLAELRDRSVFPGFQIADVKRATVSAGGRRLVVERSGETNWKVLEPSRGSATEARVTNLFLTLKALKWKEIASHSGDEAARYGLDKPELEVSVVKKDGSELGTLLVGRQEGATTYVRLRSDATIYAVPSKDLDDLRKAQSELSA